MLAYIFKASLLCEDCGQDAIRDKNAEAVAALRGGLQDTCRDIPDPDTYEADSEAWARKHPKTLAKALGFDPEDDSAFDTDNYPSGPYANGGGEADSPQHCGECGQFLDNPLTGDGQRYVIEALADHVENGNGAPDVLLVWLRRYGPTLDEGEATEAFIDLAEAILVRDSKPYSVGAVGVDGVIFKRFDTADEAASYIGTLPGHEDGRYFLDGPEALPLDFSGTRTFTAPDLTVPEDFRERAARYMPRKASGE